MAKALKISTLLLVLGGVSVSGRGITSAQEQDFSTPSQKTKEAIEKFSKTPAVVEKTLQDLSEAARAKLRQALGGKARAGGKEESSDLDLPQKKAPAAEPARFSPAGKRDPFRPPMLKTSVNSQPRENLSPLERVEWGQINLVGIVWDAKEPRALVEVAEPGDKSRGYIVRVGTPIGTNEGKVKAITRDEMIVEEYFTDVYGAKKKRQVTKKLLTEQ